MKNRLFAPLMSDALLMGAIEQQPAKTFEAPETLREAVGSWALEGLKQNGGAVLEITPEAWRATKATLSEQGYDPETLQADGRLIVFDTNKVHDQFTGNGGLRPDMFKDVARQTLERVQKAAPDGPIHVWTESVALLHHHGDPWMAQFAQSLWKETAAEYGVQLIGTMHERARDPASMDLDEEAGWCEYVSGSHDDDAASPTRPEMDPEANHLGAPEILEPGPLSLVYSWAGPPDGPADRD